MPELLSVSFVLSVVGLLQTVSFTEDFILGAGFEPMADYLLVHDSLIFAHLRPILGDAWWRRSFLRCAPHVDEWRVAALHYAEAYHIDTQEVFLLGFGPATPFSSSSWRTLVGELLVVTAAEMPELPSHLESLARLLPPSLARDALQGCGDLTFGLATYRPGLAGFNSMEDNRRLLNEFRAIDPAGWSESMLLADELDADDIIEELAYAREWFAVLVDLYERVVRDDRVIVFETMHG